MKTTNLILQVLWKLGKVHPRPNKVAGDTQDFTAILGPAPRSIIYETEYAVGIKQPFVIDQSYYDPTSYNIVSPKPKYVYARASYGAGYKDPMFVRHVQGWRSVGVPVTAYHFFLYNENLRAQINIFKSQIALAGGTQMLSMPVVLDIEGRPPEGMTPQQAADKIWGWIDAINRELGVGVWIYSSANYLNALRVGGVLPNWCTTKDAVTNEKRRFAIAGYPSDPNATTSMPLRYWPSGLDKGANGWLWQYTDQLKIHGIQGYQDGNQETNQITLTNLPTSDPSTDKRAVTTANLNVRNGPGTTYQIITTLPRGTFVTVAREENGWAYITAPILGWCFEQYLNFV